MDIKDKAFKEGQQAAASKQSISTIPYLTWSINGEAWMLGFNNPMTILMPFWEAKVRNSLICDIFDEKGKFLLSTDSTSACKIVNAHNEAIKEHIK